MTRLRSAALALALFAAPRAAMALGFGQGNRQDGGQAGQFLQASAGARPLSMGGAHTAIADDANAPFWNASGLAQLQRFDLVTYFSKLGDGANIGAGAFAMPTRRFGTFGINAVSLRSSSYKRRDAENRDLGTFDNSASAYMVSQALNLSPRFAAGYTLKAIHEQVDTYGGTGYGADLGVLLRPHALWQFGFAVQNLVQPQLKLKSETESYPTEVRFGSRFEARPKLTLAADVSMQKNRAAELSLGTEWRVAGPLALRLGVNDREFTAGMGVSIGDTGVDYAFGMPHASVAQDELGDTHRISFHLKFGTDVMAGSYRDLALRRREQTVEIARVDRGVDNIKVLENRMRSWNGQMDPSTFEQVQAARASLRELAFRDPEKALEAQAYVTHFQGRLDESARLFDRAVAKQPRNRRLRQDDVIAHERARNHPNPQALAANYDRLDRLDRRRREREAAAIARAAENAGVAGGAGSAQEPLVRASGHTTPKAPEQVAMLPMALPPISAQRPVIEKPVAPPPIVQPVPVQRPAAPVDAPRPSVTEQHKPPVEKPKAVPVKDAAKAPAAPPPAVSPPAAAAVAPVAAEKNGPPPESAAPAAPELREAKTQYEQGDFVAAHRTTKKILDANPDDRDAARQAMLTNSVVAAQAGLSDLRHQSVDVAALEAKVDQSLGLYDQGLTLYRNRRRDDAAAIWEQSVQVCPANFLSRKMLKKIEEDRFNERWDGILPRNNVGPPS